MQQIAILGSTGSIGTQALEVISAHPAAFRASALVAYHNDELLEQQIKTFQPDLAVLVDEAAARRLQQRYHGKTQILTGEEGLYAAATQTQASIVLTSMVGFAGLGPTLAAIEAGKTIALANKETLVAAGEIVMAKAKAKNVAILPVDSEHSAIFQCLQGAPAGGLGKILLTASGGPFRGRTAADLQTVSVEDCLRHPNWSMGRKITVDSATLANKGLEVIEAHWLFDVAYDDIEVVVHPQSIVHSMVEFVDGSVIAQLGQPDMRIPIQYAFTYPQRLPAEFPRLSFATLKDLSFMAPDQTTFKPLGLAFAAGKQGGTMPCVFNAANEVAVEAFLQKQLPFLAIAEVIDQVLQRHTVTFAPALPDIYAADAWARQLAKDCIKQR